MEKVVRIILVTADQSLPILIQHLVDSDGKNNTVAISITHAPDGLEMSTFKKQLILIDADKLNSEDWLSFIKMNKDHSVLVLFSENDDSTRIEIIQSLKTESIQNSIEFIILGNYSLELKLLLLRQQLLDLLNN